MSITIPAPEGIDAAGKSAVIFVSAIADTDAPKLTELSAGTHITCALYGFEPSVDQSASSFAKYCYKQPAQIPGRPTYSIANIVVDGDPQGADSSGNYDYLEVLVPGAKGFIVDRRGLDFDDPLASAQKVDIYPVEIGALNRVPIDPTSTEGQKLRDEFRVFVTGEVKHGVAITA